MQRWQLQAMLAERERLANDIHDTLAQSFAGIGFQLQAIRRAIPQSLSSVTQQVDLAQSLVRHSHKEARRSIEPLRPESTEDIELLPSLNKCAHKMVEGGNVIVSLTVTGKPRTIPSRVKHTLLRIGQEAIANSVRHANPSNIELLLNYKGNTVTLTVRDDGSGFIKSGDLLGFGLRGMRRRAAGISADLDIKSQPGSGTSITATVRLPPALSPLINLRSAFEYLSEHVIYAYKE
jgi:signal transduction histidine kinase